MCGKIRERRSGAEAEGRGLQRGGPALEPWFCYFQLCGGQCPCPGCKADSNSYLTSFLRGWHGVKLPPYRKCSTIIGTAPWIINNKTHGQWKKPDIKMHIWNCFTKKKKKRIYLYIGRRLASHTSLVTNVCKRKMVIEVKHENRLVKAVCTFTRNPSWFWWLVFRERTFSPLLTTFQ